MQPVEQPPLPASPLPVLTTQETLRLRDDYPSVEYLEANHVAAWLVERSDQLLIRARDERTGMNLAKLVNITGLSVGAVCYATSPMALIGVVVAATGYVWTVAQDLNTTHQFAPLPFIRGNFLEFLEAMGDKEMRDEWFGNKNELVDLMFHLEPVERYEFSMLKSHTHTISDYLSQVPSGKKFYAYRWLLDWFIMLKGVFPTKEDLNQHLSTVLLDPKVNYDQVLQLQGQQEYQKKIAESPPTLFKNEAVSLAALNPAEGGVSLNQQTVDVSAETVVGEAGTVIQEPESLIDRIAKAVLKCFSDNRLSLSFIEGVDGYKFHRILLRCDSSTNIVSVLKMDKALFSELGVLLPSLPKSPLVSQVKGGRIAVDIAKPKEEWKTAFFRNFIGALAAGLKGCDSPVMLPIGVDLDGNLIEINMSEHNTSSLLVGGSKGGGKTGWAKAAISSVVATYSPNSVKLILSDVEKVEFEPFRNVPHLFCPIANSAEATVKAMEAVIKEMDSRQEKFLKAGVVNIDQYNAKVLESEQLFRMLIVIEETAAIVLKSMLKDRFNKLKQDLNQRGRKWGAYLVDSTQTPRTDVIPALIRGQFVAFLAFMCSRPEESRIILGNQNEDAANLLGYGDAIFMTTYGSERCQALLIEPEEVDTVVQNAIATHGTYEDVSRKLEEDRRKLEEERRRLEKDRGTTTVSQPSSMPVPNVGTNSKASSEPVPKKSSPVELAPKDSSNPSSVPSSPPVPPASSAAVPSSKPSSSKKEDRTYQDFLLIKELRDREEPINKGTIIKSKEFWGYPGHKYGEGNARYLKAIKLHGADWIKELRSRPTRVSQIVKIVYSVPRKDEKYQHWAGLVHEVLHENLSPEEIEQIEEDEQGEYDD